MNIGELKHRISIETTNVTTNENGFKSESYTEFCKAWAKVENLHGREFFQAKQINSNASVKFLIRYIKGLNTDMRINYNDKHYNIIYIDNIKEQNKFIELLCEVLE